MLTKDKKIYKLGKHILACGDSRNAELVSSIKANENCDYSQEALESKSVDELKMLKKLMGGPADYSGQASPKVNSEDDDNVAPPMPSLFEKKD